MTDSIELVEANPVVLVKSLEEKILDGYYVNTSIEGYPQLQSFPFRVRLFKGEQPAKRIGVSDDSDNIVIDSYDQLVWMLDLQDMVLQGFQINADSVVIGNYMAATVVRKESVVEAPKAPVDDVQVKPAKTARKSKSKEV